MKSLIVKKVQENIGRKRESVTSKDVKTDQNREITVTIARTIEEIERIRRTWKRLLPFPLADLDYFLSVVSFRQEVVRPHVIILRRNGKPETILAGRIEDVQLEYRISYKAIFRPRVRSLTIVKGGMLGNTSYANCATLTSELIKSLRQKEADIISFTEIQTDSNIYQIARTVPGFLFRDHFPDVDIWYKMTLPDSINDLLKGKNRKRIRSLWRQLEKRYPEKWWLVMEQ
jgi:hypothetical protein